MDSRPILSRGACGASCRTPLVATNGGRETSADASVGKGGCKGCASEPRGVPEAVRPALSTVGGTRAGRLKHGNPSGDPSTARRCGASSRTRAGMPCRAPAVRGKKRCRLHGGLSTGPRTAAGLARSRRARWKHGRYSQQTRLERAAAVERSMAELWAEYAPWAHAAGFLIEPIRRRGFHGVRLRRPYGWRTLKRRASAALKAAFTARRAQFFGRVRG